MRLTLWGIPALLAASLLILTSTQTAEVAFAADDTWWMSDYQAALRKSEETGKPILLEFR